MQPTALIVGAHSAIAQAFIAQWQARYDLVTVSRQPAVWTGGVHHQVPDYTVESLAAVAEILQGKAVERVVCCVGTLHDAQHFPEKNCLSWSLSSCIIIFMSIPSSLRWCCGVLCRSCSRRNRGLSLF